MEGIERAERRGSNRYRKKLKKKKVIVKKSEKKGGFKKIRSQHIQRKKLSGTRGRGGYFNIKVIEGGGVRGIRRGKIQASKPR